ncbi:MAG: radical SAM protein [Pseudonocardiales bacterium]|nr:radical SAM protein [Pseudonocardiales bacterium]MBV9031844.1 radical SAM protein [Pseudonocardiales bacterium]
MTGDGWSRVIDEARTSGVTMVRFIGGEPTLHPDLSRLMRRALGRGLTAEVFSNLVRVTPQLWDMFSLPGVRLATSYYSDDPAQHEEITKRRGSRTRTKGNIIEALRRSIPPRVGVIDTHSDQRVEQAVMELEALGVADIAIDDLRQVGRGARDDRPDIDPLCGGCARGKVAVAADGEVWPCVFARWIPLGNVRTTPLDEIVTVPRMKEAHLRLSAIAAGCTPGSCDPQCPPSCSPSCIPMGNRIPAGGCGPDWR